jgi:glycosyltransferase involved in cell wall biosynthesis
MRTSINRFRISKKSMNYKLTILITTLNSRSEKLKGLVDDINYQIQSKPVELIWLGDNKSMTVGEKRNHLLSMAHGEFISYIDDDDSIASNYIDIILSAINNNPNKSVICFRGEQTTDGSKDCPFQYNIKFGRNHKDQINGVRWKLMLPDHLCVWKKSNIHEKFPNKNMGEDHDWARQMAMHYNEGDQVLLEETLYHYQSNKLESECRK